MFVEHRINRPKSEIICFIDPFEDADSNPLSSAVELITSSPVLPYVSFSFPCMFPLPEDFLEPKGYSFPRALTRSATLGAHRSDLRLKPCELSQLISANPGHWSPGKLIFRSSVT